MASTSQVVMESARCTATVLEDSLEEWDKLMMRKEVFDWKEYGGAWGSRGISIASGRNSFTSPKPAEQDWNQLWETFQHKPYKFLLCTCLHAYYTPPSVQKLGKTQRRILLLYCCYSIGMENLLLPPLAQWLLAFQMMGPAGRKVAMIILLFPRYQFKILWCPAPDATSNTVFSISMNF